VSERKGKAGGVKKKKTRAVFLQKPNAKSAKGPGQAKKKRKKSVILSRKEGGRGVGGRAPGKTQVEAEMVVTKTL